MTIQHISVIGLGKLGTPLLAVLARAGFDVVGVDVNEATVEAINAGRSPVYEPGVDDLLSTCRGRYHATTDTLETILHTEATFVIVPTPSGADGGFTLDFLLPVAHEIGIALRYKEDSHLVSITSTVMPGQTRELVREIEVASGKQHGKGFHVCYSPTFIALGSVVSNLQYPDYVLIGGSGVGSEQLHAIYARMINNNAPVVHMGWASAEIAKMAQNAFITMKITFANQIGRLCDMVEGANVDDVTGALGFDRRIGPYYLRAGTAYGGPCFPRDNVALARAYQRAGVEFDLDWTLFEVIDALNERETVRLLHAILPHAGTVGLLGMSYKPGTPSVEESASMELARALCDAGRDIVVYDPLAMNEARAVLGDSVTYAGSAAQCVERADVVVLMHPDKALAQHTFRDKVLIDPWRVMAGVTFASAHYIPLGVGVPLEAVR